jgi:hypothetical protein
MGGDCNISRSNKKRSIRGMSVWWFIWWESVG